MDMFEKVERLIAIALLVLMGVVVVAGVLEVGYIVATDLFRPPGLFRCSGEPMTRLRRTARWRTHEGVAPFEVAGDAIPHEVTPHEGQGALGAWRLSWVGAGRDSEPTTLCSRATPSQRSNLWRQGCM